MSGKAPIMCLAAKCRPLLGACLIRRSALEQAGGFDETLRFWECEEVCVKLASVGRFVSASSGEAEYLWRLHTDAPVYRSLRGPLHYKYRRVRLDKTGLEGEREPRRRQLWGYRIQISSYCCSNVRRGAERCT